MTGCNDGHGQNRGHGSGKTSDLDDGRYICLSVFFNTWRLHSSGHEKLSLKGVPGPVTGFELTHGVALGWAGQVLNFAGSGEL